ncbi:hypothetical protein HOLleu_03661 [Holothuria leucospilota]|uniref:Uncharacterized protein n=1 Tax=Holothuria leucospilota TaxID=206669 RepID=A0A9Q1CSV1_HOLLE|nr:hypothetical protein HOLleu_03661 [Holothuria leucospilota]
MQAYHDAPYTRIETLDKYYFIDELGDTVFVVAVEWQALFAVENKKGNLRRPTARALISEKKEDTIVAGPSTATFAKELGY